MKFPVRRWPRHETREIPAALRDGPMNALSLAWKLARRELRGGLKGFRIFFLCLLLGTAAIAGVESLSDAFLTGLRDSRARPSWAAMSR